MTPLLITEEVRADIRRVIALAETRPVDMTALVKQIATPDGKAEHRARMTEQTIDIPLAFRVTFSIETNHPCGTCRHMSMSVQRDGRAPNPVGLWMVAEEYGFRGSLRECTVWPEKLQGHGVAINVVQPILP